MTFWKDKWPLGEEMGGSFENVCLGVVGRLLIFYDKVSLAWLLRAGD